ncbi:MAG: hypothetical protein LBL13_06285 [Bacteroidales bacterium]|nr:hypothetical protein [Bacteroidales bacterium]
MIKGIKGRKGKRQQATGNKQQAGKPRRAKGTKGRKGERAKGKRQQATSNRQASQEGRRDERAKGIGSKQQATGRQATRNKVNVVNLRNAGRHSMWVTPCKRSAARGQNVLDCVVPRNDGLTNSSVFDCFVHRNDGSVNVVVIHSPVIANAVKQSRRKTLTNAPVYLSFSTPNGVELSRSSDKENVFYPELRSACMELPMLNAFKHSLS